MTGRGRELGHGEAVRRVEGRLLIDPARGAEFGRVELEGGRIASVRVGEEAGGWGEVGGVDRVVCPAFYDAHMHLPQAESVGCDGMELLEWLQRVIFPAEAWWGRGGAVPMARVAARRLVREGTLGVAAYATSHAEASRDALGLIASQTPLRFVAGRVAMDRFAPEALMAEDRARASSRPVPAPVLAAVGDGGERHRVSLNPRFAVACSEELLAECGWYRREHPGVFVQTHLAESEAECAEVARLFPGDADYTSVYDRMGLLGERTLLAHGIHLSESEWGLIASRGSVVVHCPTANTFLGAGQFDLDAARRHGVRVALGSDVAAGPDFAMPRVARGMIEVAKSRAMAGVGSHVPSPAEAWSLITRGNAAALGWERGGLLEEGADADLLVLRVPATWLDEHLVGRLIYNWSPELIEARIAGGRYVSMDRVASDPWAG